MKWTFKDRSVSDWGYVFFSLPFDTEGEARAHFDKAKERAREFGGAGSLHNPDGTMIDKFSTWCRND